jgi:hypothetical protein
MGAGNPGRRAATSRRGDEGRSSCTGRPFDKLRDPTLVTVASEGLDKLRDRTLSPVAVWAEAQETLKVPPTKLESILRRPYCNLWEPLRQGQQTRVNPKGPTP